MEKNFLFYAEKLTLLLSECCAMTMLMKRFVWIVFLIFYTLSFSAEHVDFNMDQAKGYSSLVKTAVESTNQNFSLPCETHQSHDQSCTDCALGFCVHQITFPMQYSCDFFVFKESNLGFLFYGLLYKNPFGSGLNRPPIA